MALLIGFCYYSVFGFLNFTAQVAMYQILVHSDVHRKFWDLFFLIKTIDFSLYCTYRKKKGDFAFSVW